MTAAAARSLLAALKPGSRAVAAGMALGLLLLTGCTVGPKYVRPSAPVPAAYKETGQWAPAQPMEELPRGNWWEIYNDRQLNSLEEKIEVSNQNLKQAQDQFLEARALVHFSRAGFFPVVTGALAGYRNHISNNHQAPSSTNGLTYDDYQMPYEVIYEPDVWAKCAALWKPAAPERRPAPPNWQMLLSACTPSWQQTISSCAVWIRRNSC